MHAPTYFFRVERSQLLGEKETHMHSSAMMVQLWFLFWSSSKHAWFLVSVSFHLCASSSIYSSASWRANANHFMIDPPHDPPVLGPDTWNGKSGHLEPQDRTLEGYWGCTLYTPFHWPAALTWKHWHTAFFQVLVMSGCKSENCSIQSNCRRIWILLSDRLTRLTLLQPKVTCTRT